MGINLELAVLLDRLATAGALEARRGVIELGAQTVTADPRTLRAFLARSGRDPGPGAGKIDAPRLYAAFGLAPYDAIDSNGEAGARVFDLNLDLRERYGFSERFDLVTNLGTAEHCFHQEQVFANVHALCRTGGLMIHAAPALGLVNHGFYAYSPKLFRDLADANAYRLLALEFSVDLKPRLFPYTLRDFVRQRGRDVLLYAVLRKTHDGPFRRPFDRSYVEASQLGAGYGAAGPPDGPDPKEFRSVVRSRGGISRSLARAWRKARRARAGARRP